MAHRLRAMPFLGRNMGVVSGGLLVVIGLTIAFNYPYRSGISSVSMGVLDASGAQVTRTIALRSSSGGAMVAWCLLGGLAALAYEYWTWGNAVVRVERKLWHARVGLYGVLALPGYLTFFTDGLMPVLLPSVFCTIACAVNAAACVAELPDEQRWRWHPCGGGAAAKKKADETGGKPPGLFDKLDCRTLFEQGSLPRFIFLTSYVAINVTVGMHAFLRHGWSEKGKALRGEAFLGCEVSSGFKGAPGIAPLPVCLFTIPCPTDDATCPNGNAPILVPEATPPLLQTFGVGFGWFGYPTAKAMGQLLNLNCAILLTPVTHGFMTKMQDMTAYYGHPCVKWLSNVIPFDKAVVFHKACAKYFLLPAVAVHAILHYFNYGRAPYYNAIFGDGVYPATPSEAAWGVDYGGYGLSGNVIVVAMFFIYCGAHERVKRAHYETFWNTHHWFVVFFAALGFHGSVFYQWALATVLPYAVDRFIFRIYCRGNKPFALLRVYFWRTKKKKKKGDRDTEDELGPDGRRKKKLPQVPDVVTLQFENGISDKGGRPMRYMEGHYLYLQCPHIEGRRNGVTLNNTLLKQWHPFTISSAPDEPILEVNIRVVPSKHSWTYQMAKYLMLYEVYDEYDPDQSGAVEFVTRNPNSEQGGVMLGKVTGADGLPFFHVDGPHGAPSQHIFNYKTTMIVGAGIGVTPCSSIMRGIVKYRWKKNFQPNTLYFFWVARLSDLVYFHWLLMMLPELKADEGLHNEYYGSDPQRIEALRRRIEELRLQISGKDGKAPAPVPPPALPAGWAESRTPTGDVYYVNQATGETSWVSPSAAGGDIGSGPSDNPKAELARLQAALREASTNMRRLECTLYLTGVKPEQLKYKADAVPGEDNVQDMLNVLLATKDPVTGEPYIKLKAGRPDWPGDFQRIGAIHGREDVGVIFCGAPMIAAALKENCEKYSRRDGTIFRLHKENF